MANELRGYVISVRDNYDATPTIYKTLEKEIVIEAMKRLSGTSKIWTITPVTEMVACGCCVRWPDEAKYAPELWKSDMADSWKERVFGEELPSVAKLTNKIAAIKALQAITGLELRDAKELVELITEIGGYFEQEQTIDDAKILNVVRKKYEDAYDKSTAAYNVWLDLSKKSQDLQRIVEALQEDN